jgi:hypothetical protein
MGPRKVGYFISGSSRLSGELGAYKVEGDQVFESPEKPFTTTDLMPAGALNSDVAMVPQNAERVEDNRVSDRQFIGGNHNFVGVADNWIKCLTPALVVDDTVTVFTSCLGVVPVALIQGCFVVRHSRISWVWKHRRSRSFLVHSQDQPVRTTDLFGARPTS